MSDETRKSVVPLARPGRLRASWRRRFAWLVAAVGLCAVLIGRYPVLIGRYPDNAHRDSDIAHRGADCAATAHSAPAMAVEVCQLEFRRTHDPKTAMHLAEALFAIGDVFTAKWRLPLLLATPARSDALLLLGRIARAEDRFEDAVNLLEAARRLHRAEGSPGQLARDDGELAWVRTNRSEFVDALQLINECIKKAQEIGDAGLQGYCHTVAARTLICVGYFSAAEQELKEAAPLVTTEQARIDLRYQQGNIAQESGQPRLAIAIFREVLSRHVALEHSEGLSRSIGIIKTELNLAYSLAEQGEFDEAQRQLDDATFRDVDHKHEPERTWTAAQIAFQQRRLTQASSLNETYFKLLGGNDSVDRDDQIEVATLQARIELARNDLGAAERWARHAKEQAERVRDAQSVLELRSSVLDKRRAPYELLFTALARSGQVEAAAMAFGEWQGRTVQDALARPRPPASLGPGAIAEQVSNLDRWLRAASKAPFAKSPDRDSVLSTLRGIDLLALIVADNEVWSLTANHGPPQLSRIAALADIKARVDEFRGHSRDIEPASELGALLLPDRSFRATRDVLHVLIDGRLDAVPVAALRRGGKALIEMRPIVRMLWLPETRCVHAGGSGHATVLADPRNNLEKARTEGEEVARLLDATSKFGTAATKFGTAATKAALFDAAHDAVLHVAAHATTGKDGTILLADLEVSALEISAGQVAPALAVLSTCNAATSEDTELAGSLAAGFLAAGSQHVVATLRPVTDDGALDISKRFYLADGVADPARALEAVQAELMHTSNVDWPYFTVFGPDVCAENAPDHR